MDVLHEVERDVRAGTRQDTPVERRVPMSYDEFASTLEDSTHAEWVNGEAVIFMPPTTRHQRMVSFLNMLLGLFLQVHPSGELFVAPYAMWLDDRESLREPDLLYVAKEHAQRIGDNRLNGPADLVIEVVSTESLARDRTEKFYEYQAGGVREYWVIDPRPGVARADFWVLDDKGTYRPVPISDDGTYVSSVLPNFKLNVTALLADELPNPLHALAEMIGMDALMQALQRNE